MIANRSLRTRVLLACIASVVVSGVATAAEPSTAPILQVEVGMHSSNIRASALATSERFVVTGSADKTARLWELPSLRLRRTFRIPVGQGPEGRIHDVAISRDEHWLAVAGWTGWEWDQQASVYFFEISTGAMVGRLSGLPQAVRNLAYSPDGKFLAVGLMGGGLRIHRTNGYSEHYVDPHYDERIVSLDFASDGRLAVSSADGIVRIYSADFGTKRQFDVARVSEPLEVRFSPDGTKLAVGYRNVARVDIIDLANLSLLFSPAVPSTASLRSLYAVEWSADGKRLFAAGERKDQGQNLLLEWAKAGKGSVREIPTSRARMGRLLPLADGSLFWGAEDPAMALLSPDGSEVARRDPSTLDFAGLADRLLLSPDGLFVSLAPVLEGEAREFALDLQKRGDYFPDYLALAPSSGRGAEIEIAPTGESAVIDGRSVQLEPFEIIRHHAWSHDGAQVVLATEWAVRVFDAKGAPLWDVPLSVVAHAVNVSADSRWVVAALSDGTLRWYSLRDGSPGPALFLHSNRVDWVTWLPSGHYAASPNGDRYVGWLENRAADESPVFRRAVQFEQKFYDAERVRKSLLSDSSQGGPPLSAAALAAIAPPDVALDISSTLMPQLKGPIANIRLRARRNGPPMTRLNVFVNKIPIIALQQRSISGSEQDWLDRIVSIPLGEGHNEVLVEIDTPNSRGTTTLVVENIGEDTSQSIGDLYAVAIGVNELTYLDRDLTYAATDAKRIEEVLRRQEGMAFRNVHTKLVADGAIEPTREAIEETLNFLKQAGPYDTAVLFLAGHGVRDHAGNYYFVPKDASQQDLDRLNHGKTGAASFVEWKHFVRALQDSAGRRVLIVDTCHAQQITGSLKLDWLAKYSASSLFVLLASSAADELSAENQHFGAGLYTEGVVRALQGSADQDKSKEVNVREVHDYAGRFVVERRGTKQVPQFVAPPELQATRLAVARPGKMAAVGWVPTGQEDLTNRGLGLPKAGKTPPPSIEPRYDSAEFDRRMKRISEGGVMDLEIGFEIGSYDLEAMSKLNLESAAAILSSRDFGKRELLVRAQATGKGGSDVARKLAWSRAEAVRSYLLRRWNLQPTLLHARGPEPMDDNPKDSTDTSPGPLIQLEIGASQHEIGEGH